MFLIQNATEIYWKLSVEWTVEKIGNHLKSSNTNLS